MQTEGSRRLTRREALATGLATAGALALGRCPDATAADNNGPYGPFKMGLQSYSLRGYKQDGKPDLTKALAVTQDLGLHYWEAYPAHLPMVDNAESIVKYRDQCKAAGVSVIGYGVSHFGKDHEANQKIFRFAKALGVGYLSADPDPDSFDSLDKLVEEYGVAIGIHPHGPGSRWAKIDDIHSAIKDHHPKIGICLDTGHLLRSSEDPLRAVEVLGKRIYGVHLKDVKDGNTFTVLGKGDLKVAALLQALAMYDYKYCLALEYEENEANPIDDLQACLKAVRAAVATIKKA